MQKLQAARHRNHVRLASKHGTKTISRCSRAQLSTFFSAHRQPAILYGALQVSDFGLARALLFSDRLQTHAYGTLTHMAPEVVLTGIQFPAADGAPSTIVSPHLRRHLVARCCGAISVGTQGVGNYSDQFWRHSGTLCCKQRLVAAL